MTEEEILAQELKNRKKPKAVRVKKPKPPKKEKVVKTEEQLVREYVDRVIGGKIARGHVDDRFAYTKKESTVNKELWMDQDFFFSVVFQSFEQKYAFLEALKIDTELCERVQIVNGIKLAEKLGVKLKKEVARPYPYPDLDLREIILDDEKII
jgi:hypothetical protein